MPTKSFNSLHWKLTVKLPQINSTDIDSEYDLQKAKQKLLSELEILLESDVYPMFNRVIIKPLDKRPELP